VEALNIFWIKFLGENKKTTAKGVISNSKLRLTVRRACKLREGRTRKNFGRFRNHTGKSSRFQEKEATDEHSARRKKISVKSERTSVVRGFNNRKKEAASNAAGGPQAGE